MRSTKISFILAAALAITFTLIGSAMAQEAKPADEPTATPATVDETTTCTADGACTEQRTRVFVFNTEDPAPVVAQTPPPAPSPVTLKVSKPWRFGLNVELMDLHHDDFDRVVYTLGVHLGFSRGKNKVVVAGGIGGCAVSHSWDDLALTATIHYTRQLSKGIGLGGGFRGTACYDLRADDEQNQTINAFGPEVVVPVSNLTFGVGLDSFSRFREGEKRQMGGVWLVFMRGNLPVMKF